MSGETPSPMPIGLNVRLSLMMFLQYAIWGAWLPLLYPFLIGHRGWSADAVGTVLAGGAAGAIVGPFIAGQIADRYFATEKFLGISHLVGAVLVWALADISSFWVFLSISVLYGIVYAPTLALTNSLSFHHIPDRDRDFGRVRVWGTVGWIVAGIAVGQWLLLRHTPDPSMGDAAIKAAQDAGRADAFRLSGILGILMGLYCFSLPHTPPAKQEKDENAAAEAIREVRRQPLVTLFLLAVPISIIHQFYFVHTAEFLTKIQIAEGATGLSNAINRVLGVGGGGLMTIGQMTEIAVLALIPLVAKRLRRKTLLAVGIIAYGIRMALFAYINQIESAVGVPPIVTAILGVSLHGFCFGCFIFVGFMVVDEETTSDVRATAQNLFNLVIVGIGIIVGSWFATSLAVRWSAESVVDAAGQVVVNAAGEPEKVTNYTTLFSIPMWIAVACLLVLLVFYPARGRGRGGPRDQSDRTIDDGPPASAPTD